MRLVPHGEKLNRKQQIGFLNHLVAMQWLTKKNYYVFHNISGLGPCDLIALNGKGKIIKIDVKIESIIKTGTHAGHKIRRMTTKLQQKMGIKLLMVTKEG